IRRRKDLRAFAAIGWKWGGNWNGSKDYQHFSSSGNDFFTDTITMDETDSSQVNFTPVS
ncbi:MAG: M15 family metallopeptidase, partial [Chloroflexi bacterium]|nr:M15 family metallopeptidase [Chloroflexota bacterium]